METPRTLIRWGLVVTLAWLAACAVGRVTPEASPTTPLAASPSVTPSAQPSATPSPTPPPTVTPTPLTCWSQGGRMEIHQLSVAETPWPLDFRVYLPPCYDAQPQRAYPVLYLIHGQNFTDDQWDRLGVDEVLDRRIPQGDLPPFLVVMPRDREWTQPNEDGFGKAVVQELLPWVDAHYRTLTDRKYRAIGGLSRGAAWALHLAFTRWDLFGAVGGHSPPVFWTDAPHMPDWLAAIPPENWPRIWLDVGDMDRQEILESAEWLEALLTQMGIPHEWHLYTGQHNETYWRAHVEEYLRWYAAPWQGTGAPRDGGK